MTSQPSQPPNAPDSAPATDRGQTRPAGAGTSDDELVTEVAGQTSSDLHAEDVFERESDGAAGDTAADDVDATDLS